MEIDSAKRHGAKVVFIIANNAAWNIERLDQEMNYEGRVVGYAATFRIESGDTTTHARRTTGESR